MTPLKYLLVTSILLLTGCYRISLQSPRDQAIMLSSQHVLKTKHYKIIRHFRQVRELHFVFGLPLENETDRILSQVLDQEITPQQQVINLRVTRTVNPINQINTLLTLGIYLRTQLIIEGDILEKI